MNGLPNDPLLAKLQGLRSVPLAPGFEGRLGEALEAARLQDAAGGNVVHLPRRRTRALIILGMMSLPLAAAAAGGAWHLWHSKSVVSIPAVTTKKSVSTVAPSRPPAAVVLSRSPEPQAATQTPVVATEARSARGSRPTRTTKVAPRRETSTARRATSTPEAEAKPVARGPVERLELDWSDTPQAPRGNSEIASKLRESGQAMQRREGGRDSSSVSARTDQLRQNQARRGGEARGQNGGRQEMRNMQRARAGRE